MLEKSFLNHFILKIIAIISMSIDHIAKILINYNYLDKNSILAIILLIIGRIALPIFIYLLIDGMIKTKNPKRFLLRLGISYLLGIFIYMILGSFFNDLKEFLYYGNIFADLFFIGLATYFLFRVNKKYVKLLFILPLLFLLIGGIYKIYYLDGTIIFNNDYLISGFLTQSDFIGFILSLLFLSSYYFIDHYLIKKYHYYFNDEDKINISRITFTKNIFATATILITSLISYLIYRFLNINTLDFNIQSYMFISSIFILFYNGKLGYHNLILKYGAYCYYPLHLLIIILIVNFI